MNRCTTSSSTQSPSRIGNDSNRFVITDDALEQLKHFFNLLKVSTLYYILKTKTIYSEENI